MKSLLYLVILLGVQSFTPIMPTGVNAVYLTKEEKLLYDLIMSYRKDKGLPMIPVSVKLTLVAKTHTNDLNDNYQVDYHQICNPHSWSDKGRWSYCCYTEDHRYRQCMWQKPMEIAGYANSGYEIVCFNLGGTTARESFDGWRNSAGHNPVLINEGPWSKLKWRAIGISVNKDYSAVWFGELKDVDAVIVCP
jgi:uncharacterized protein YkwD